MGSDLTPSMYSCIPIISTEDMHATRNTQPFLLSPTSHSHLRTHLITQSTEAQIPDKMMSYTRYRTKHARSVTNKTPPAQRTFSADLMHWEYASAEHCGGVIVPEDPVLPADDSEQLIV